MKMRLDFRLDLLVVVLLLVLISNVHFKCQVALASSPSSQPRQIGQQTGKHGPNVDRLAAILAAKPRPLGSSTQSTTSQQQQAQHDTNNATTSHQAAKLSSEASNLDHSRASVSNLTGATSTNVQSARLPLTVAKSTAKSQGKRQAGEFVDQNRSPSRRNEDPWFLDQAPLPLQPYRFNYNVKDKNGLTEQYRQETGDGKFLTGSYGYVLPDGIFRHVDYVADDRGFRAFIRTSEPGTANQNPADVVINSSPVPGAGYVSPPPSAAGLGNLGTGSLLLGAQQPQQQQSWADQQQQQPRAAWNYTTFRPSSAFSSLNNLDLKSNLDGSGVLPRRAPGSIVGTPLRDFSSFAYPFVPPSSSSSLELTHPTQSSYLTSQDQPSNTRHTSFPSLSRFGDLRRLSQPIGGGSSGGSSSSGGGGGSSSLSSSNNFTNLQNTISDDQRFNTHLTSGSGTKSDHERDRFSTSSGPGSSSFQGAGNYLGGSAHLEGAHDRPGSLLFATQPLYHHRPGLLLPSRVGPNVLLYDRPFGVHQLPNGGDAGGSNKLSYDYNHILARGDSTTPPYLAEERAKSLAYLDQLKALSRKDIAPIRPDLVSNELGTLVPFGGSGGQSAAQQASAVVGGINNELSTKTTSSSHHSEHHQEHKSTTSQVVDDLTRITLTREHKSGSSLGSGHDSGSTSSHQLPASGETQGSLLTPPPQPQFGNNRDGQQRWATKGQPHHQPQQQQQQQLQFARLLAPYADEHQFGRKGGVKGVYEQQQQTTPVAPVAGPDEPRSPVEPSSPATIGASDSQSTRTTPADEIELNQTNASKTTPSQTMVMRPTHGQHQVRSVRMPDNYRTSMMMNDLRSMQNALGLPQPPRLQRSSSSSIDDAEPSGGPTHGPTTNLADHIVSVRMNRVEALLNGGGGAISSQPVAPQQASIQRSVAVRAEKREQSPGELRLQEEADKLDRASLLAILSKTFDNEIDDDDDDQPRRSNTGHSSAGALPTHHSHHQKQQLSSGSNQGNESSVFDAQRLRNSNKARLRADKVSELEKFQQRLRAQQLLLEHMKQQSNSDNNKASPATTTANALNSTSHRSQATTSTKANNGPTTIKVNEANSHVKYDEPPQENELGLHLSGSSGGRIDEPTRSRRQNDLSETTAPTNKTTSLRKASNNIETIRSSSPQTVVTTRAPVSSEFARQLHQWPSVSAGLERQRMSNSSSSNSSTTSGAPVAFKAHKMDTPPAKQAARFSGGQDGTMMSNARRILESPTTTTTMANNTNNNSTKRDSPNTINLDFINSVTALSMDHLNPFAISSVNPAVQRTAGSGANGERLSPHRLVMPGTSSVQQQQPEQSTGGANLLATAPARYFSSPELLAALNHHDRHDTGQRMRNLLSLEPQFEPANHRTMTTTTTTSALGGANGASGSPNAPYMMHSLAEQTEAAGARSLNGLLGAKFIVAPATSGSTSLMSEAANSQHKNVVPGPSVGSDESVGLIRQAAGGTRSQAARSVELIQRDGFEIRDRAVQADNHRFYEVVSSLRQPTEQANGLNFQAFRGE